jgi:hypothetical protein
LNGLTLVEFEKLHPFEEQGLILEKDLLLVIDAVSVADLKAKAVVDFIDPLDRESLEADDVDRLIESIFLADN